MEQKIVVITGANSGIGKAAAKKFASEGFHVIMACRTIETSRKVQEEIIRVSGNNQVDLMKLDVSSFASIISFFEEFDKTYDRLDILINNAGSFHHGEKTYRFSPENIEITWATNTFGPFLLNMLFREKLSKSQDSRVLNACTTNIKHFLDPKRNIDYDNLRGELRDSRPYNVYKLYGDSKMALMMLTIKLAQVFEKDSIRVNAVLIPGIKQSGESRKKFQGWSWKLIAAIMQPFLRTPERMAETYFQVCASSDFQEVSGRLVNIHNQVMGMPSIIPGEEVKTNPKELWHMTQVPGYALHPKNIQKIWEVSLELTKDYMKA